MRAGGGNGMWVRVICDDAWSAALLALVVGATPGSVLIVTGNSLFEFVSSPGGLGINGNP